MINKRGWCDEREGKMWWKRGKDDKREGKKMINKRERRWCMRQEEDDNKGEGKGKIIT